MLIGMTTFCNNKAHIVRLGGLWLYFSYETCIGMSYGGECIRCINKWGPTTGRHINQMGIRDYKEVEYSVLAEKVHAAVRQHGLDLFNASLASK